MKKCNIENCDTADIACDSYHHLDRDIQNILSMGIKNYRFSISWSRLLPTGTRSGTDMSTDALVRKQTADGNRKLHKSSGGINWSAVAYYNHLIDMLVLHDITLFVTLFHYDLPQDLQNQYDGWLGMELCVCSLRIIPHQFFVRLFLQLTTENSNNQVTR